MRSGMAIAIPKTQRMSLLRIVFLSYFPHFFYNLIYTNLYILNRSQYSLGDELYPENIVKNKIL
jgi:hypothetical protein